MVVLLLFVAWRNISAIPWRDISIKQEIVSGGIWRNKSQEAWTLTWIEKKEKKRKQYFKNDKQRITLYFNDPIDCLF